jgi:hypothetical protein
VIAQFCEIALGSPLDRSSRRRIRDGVVLCEDRSSPPFDVRDQQYPRVRVAACRYAMRDSRIKVHRIASFKSVVLSGERQQQRSLEHIQQLRSFVLVTSVKFRQSAQTRRAATSVEHKDLLRDRRRTKLTVLLPNWQQTTKRRTLRANREKSCEAR